MFFFFGDLITENLAEVIRSLEWAAIEGYDRGRQREAEAASVREINAQLEKSKAAILSRVG